MQQTFIFFSILNDNKNFYQYASSTRKDLNNKKVTFWRTL